MPKLSTTWSLPVRPKKTTDDELVWDGPEPWPEHKEKLLAKLTGPNANPELLSDIDKKALKLALAEQLNGSVIIDNTNIFTQMSLKMAQEIAQEEDKRILEHIAQIVQTMAKVVHGAIT